MDPLLTVAEVADALADTERHVRELARSGQLPTVKVGKKLRFAPADLAEFVEANRRGGDQ